MSASAAASPLSPWFTGAKPIKQTESACISRLRRALRASARLRRAFRASAGKPAVILTAESRPLCDLASQRGFCYAARAASTVREGS